MQLESAWDFLQSWQNKNITLAQTRTLTHTNIWKTNKDEKSIKKKNKVEFKTRGLGKYSHINKQMKNTNTEKQKNLLFSKSQEIESL